MQTEVNFWARVQLPVAVGRLRSIVSFAGDGSPRGMDVGYLGDPAMQVLVGVLFGIAVLSAERGADNPYGDIGVFKVAKPEDRVDCKPVPPPRGAIILFDGKGFDNWIMRDGKTEPQWQLVD